MTKMDAVGHLCKIKKELEDRVRYYRDGNHDELDPGLLEYKRIAADEIEQQIRALEMAGTAMTR